METRVYVVSGAGRTRLVRAINQAQALRFVASDVFTVAVAKQDQLIELVGDGTKVEIAKDEAS
jgi:hypothetical protein